MFFILGFSNKDEFIKEVNFKCTNCLNEKFELYQIANVLTFFFIPLFKFNKKILIVCKNCKSIYKIKNQSLIKILNSNTVTYDDIEEIITNNNVCPNCGYMINNNDKFCPNCGNKL